MHWLLYFTLIMMRCGDIEVNPGPSSVTEEEFLRLAQLIPPRYYKDVGIHLGIPDAELDHIIVQHSSDYKDALMSVFIRWRNEQRPDEDIRALLAEGLEKSDLGGLSKEVLAGNGIQRRPGEPMVIPGLETQELSPDLIKRCKDDLQFKYRTNFCMIRADPLDPNSIVPFKEMYTNLFLEKENKNEKSQIEYKDLFNLKVNGKFPKRIMVQGEAGAGKTTFLAKIAWDWMNDSPDLSKFVWLLLIRLREAKRYTIGRIVKSYLSKDNPAAACQITAYIRSNPDKVFIACDGLDEFSGKIIQDTETKQELEGAQPEAKVGFETSPATANSLARGDIVVEDVLRSEEVRDCLVMVTSRPWKANKIRWNNNLRPLYTFIYVEGFSRENAKVYIRNYFKDTEATADEFIQLFESNDIISENMAPYPIYISMLCHMWGEIGDAKKEELKYLQTFSEIFREVFEFLKVRYVQKEVTDLSSPLFNTRRFEVEKLMEPIAEVAFSGLQSNNLLFNEEDLGQIPDSLKTACNVGVLTQEKKLSSIHDRSSAFLQSTTFFPHKLFQEYMAAVYLASLYDSNLIEFKRLFEEVLLPRKEEFKYLLFFTVSRDRNIAEYTTTCLLRQYTLKQYDDPWQAMNFLVDVAFESQDEDTIAFLRNSVSSKLIINAENAHTVAGYAYTGIYSKAIKIDFGTFGSRYGPGISNEVALMVCSAPSLTKVKLWGIFHPTFYDTLAQEGRKTKVHTFEIRNFQPLSSASSHQLAEAICSLPDLENLTLKGDGYQEEFYSHLNAKASTLKVHTLQIMMDKGLSSASECHLVEALRSLPNLINLELTAVGDQKEFCRHLVEQAPFFRINEGKFKLNGKLHRDLDSFVESLTLLMEK
ncbi:uncharacterized protein LOC121419561 [Lytechinus variegatus]|uniref:uncharacterized protein LOC121419561 n=1 Tax=Lytechinus variegatus TaxID=7654 RepID=UPI001BB24379|nr:uncharacterized protein LOC121419561 [Lytechinus variegatus]